MDATYRSVGCPASRQPWSNTAAASGEVTTTYSNAPFGQFGDEEKNPKARGSSVSIAIIKRKGLRVMRHLRKHGISRICVRKSTLAKAPGNRCRCAPTPCAMHGKSTVVSPFASSNSASLSFLPSSRVSATIALWGTTRHRRTCLPCRNGRLCSSLLLHRCCCPKHVTLWNTGKTVKT